MMDESDLHSGLYYPYKRIRKEFTLTTALLLQDRMHIISPRDDFKVEYPLDLENRDLQMMAVEVIGKCDVPTEQQKSRAHELISEFCELPAVSAFRNRWRELPDIAAQDIDSEVLSGDTWNLLMEKSLCGPIRNDGDHEFPKAIGQKLMCILADCCAYRGELPALGKVTDQEEFFGTMLGVILEESEFQQGRAIRALSIASLEIVNTDIIGLKRLIDFRALETKGDIELRRGFKFYVEEHARQLADCLTDEAWNDEVSRYKSQILDSIKHLKERLKIAHSENINFKTLVAPTQGTIAEWVHGENIQREQPSVQPSGLIVERDTLSVRKNGWTRYLASRDLEIKSCPPAYLYEAMGQPIGSHPGFRWLGMAEEPIARS
jgi:hypothetical protein